MQSNVMSCHVAERNAEVAVPTVSLARSSREICRLLRAKRPRAFLLENVASLYTMEGGRFHAEVRSQ